MKIIIQPTLKGRIYFLLQIFFSKEITINEYSELWGKFRI